MYADESYSHTAKNVLPVLHHDWLAKVFYISYATIDILNKHDDFKRENIINK